MEYEALKKNSNAAEDMYAKSSSHPEVNKDKDEEENSYPEGTADLDADASSLPEVPKYHYVPFAGARNEGNKQNNPDYDTTMGLYVANIDKNDKIHGGQYTRQLMNLTL